MLTKSDKLQNVIGRKHFLNILKLKHNQKRKGEMKMKFNEKLIELRKKAGLSQEELGYKLNVTRQTISKWELGQTTPEMDKLLETSRIFGISVDDLLDETKEVKTESQKIINNKSKKKTIIIIVGVVLAIIILLGILGINFAKKLFNSVGEQSQKGTQMAEDLFEKGLDMAEQQKQEAKEENQEKQEEFNQMTNQMLEEYDQQVEKSNQLRQQMIQQ